VGDFIYVKVIPEAGNGEPRDVGLCPRCHHHIMFRARKPTGVTMSASASPPHL
jgi:hypothetical protein